MPDEAQKAEYVLNDTGYLYRIRYITEWTYGQFEEDILDICLYLVDKSQLEPNDRKDPVKITRAMTALVNMEDDNGVLFGKWGLKVTEGSCEGFPCPGHWKGSIRILKQYYRTKKPVLYAQCWVFSGVLTTVMRCLGIPTRSVTTYNAGIDTDNNATIDLNENGSTKDGWWNFHVWNDVWMKRPDLPKGYDGWQAVDGSPQRKKEGISCYGPASLKAIKHGEVSHDYDTTFLFSAVNAEILHWRVNGKGTYVPEKDKDKKIGTRIITKALGEGEAPEDIINEYKFPEGSKKEINALLTALFHERASKILKPNIKLHLKEENEILPGGDDIVLHIIVKNIYADALTVDLSASFHLESYAGKVHAEFSPVKETVFVGSKQDFFVKKKISVKDYIKILSQTENELRVKVKISGHVQETKETYTETVRLNFQYPQLKLEMPETAKVNGKFNCEVIFKNTFSIPLENCKLFVEDLDIYPVKAFDMGVVQAGEIKTKKIECVAKKTGDQMIVAKWKSTQVKGMTAVKFIVIQ